MDMLQKKEFKNPYLSHGGWKNKADEKRYNHEYYLKNKDKWEKYYKKQYRKTDATSDQALGEWADAQVSADKIGRKVDKMERYKDKHFDHYKEGEQNYQQHWAKNWDRLAKEEVEKAKRHAKTGNSEAVAENQQWAIKYEKAAKKMRQQGAAEQMAYNEMQKQLASAKTYQAQQQAKADAIKAERERQKKRNKNPAYKAGKSFVSSWKLGADEIKQTASKGASFIENLLNK